MKLSTGIIEIPLEFDNGDTEYIKIRSRDNGLMERIKNFEKSMHERIQNINFEKYKDDFGKDISIESFDFKSLMEMAPEQLAEIEKKASTLNAIDDEINQQFKDEIDSIFGSDISSKAFKYLQPLDIVDESGIPYIMQVMNAIATELQKRGAKLNEIANNKHAAKYKK